MAPLNCRMFRLHGCDDRVSEEGMVETIYLVQWLGYAKETQWTWEPKSKIISVGGERIILDYEDWDRYRKGNGTQTRGQWQRGRAARTVGANGRGTCVLDTLRAASRMLGHPDFF